MVITKKGQYICHPKRALQLSLYNDQYVCHPKQRASMVTIAKDSVYMLTFQKNLYNYHSKRLSIHVIPEWF